MDNQKFDNLLKDPRTNWKFIWIVVILAFLVDGGILGYYYLWIADLETKLAELEVRLPEKIIKDETAVWKTYRNEKYGFEVEYPPGWYVKENGLENPEVEFQLLFSQEPIPEDIPPLTHPWPELNIIVLKKDHLESDIRRSGLTEGDLVEGTLLNQLRYEPISFAGAAANKITSASPPQIDFPATEIIFNALGYGWSISYPNTDYEGGHDQIYDQILSTFRFF